MNLIKRIFNYINPPSGWQLPVIALAGIIAGILMLILHISRAGSYLSDEPRTCINCHVMYPQYATWFHSSHREVATCNDCHVPQDMLFRTYFFKAMDGMRHSTMFTLRLEPQVIEIKSAGIAVVQENCIRCHSNQVDMVSLIEVNGDNYKEGKGKRCWDCHREVPHGTVNSLASAPHALVPRLPSVLPDWLNKYINKEKEQNAKK